MSKPSAFIPLCNWFNRQEESKRSLKISNLNLHAVKSACKYPHHSSDEATSSKPSLIAYLANMIKFNFKLLISMLELRKKPSNFVSFFIVHINGSSYFWYCLLVSHKFSVYCLSVSWWCLLSFSYFFYRNLLCYLSYLYFYAFL